MIQPSKIFENYFEDPRITPARLANFSGDCINKLKAHGNGDAYTKLILLIGPAYKNLLDEVSHTDTSLNIQKGKTLLLDDFIAYFKKTMSEKEGVIAHALGGFDAPEFLQFYPAGVSEYTYATKAGTGKLVNRIYTVAATYKPLLGETLAGTLEAFLAKWKALLSNQQQQKGQVQQHRYGRTKARAALEIILLQVVYAIAGMFPGNTEKCMSFFDFSLLWGAAPRKVKDVMEATVPFGATSVVRNRMFSENASIKITNTADNASLFVCLEPLPDTPMNGHGREVKAGMSRTFSVNELGDLNNTYLLVHKLSKMNDAGYVAELKG